MACRPARPSGCATRSSAPRAPASSWWPAPRSSRSPTRRDSCPWGFQPVRAPLRSCLLARELRWALLEERGDALGVVAGAAGLVLEVRLGLERGIELAAPAVLEGALGERDRTRRRRGESRGGGHRLRGELIRRNHAPDEPDPLRLRGRDRL